MDRAAQGFVDKYTRPDGTLIWRTEWPGMDGSDDAYESFVSFPLFYLLGGSEHVHNLARREWDAVTRQFTQLGQVYREFDAYYDWMHHGESYTYLHYLGLANPRHEIDRMRALRFAAMYTGNDPEAPNWDAELKMIRSPINGSRGPRFSMSAEDWVTHRPILADYLSPYEDVPGFPLTDPLGKLNWNDDATFAAILKLMNERMAPGDVPLNLDATSLIASAFMYTEDERYRQWVLDYLGAWDERTRRNGGIMPDNIGPSGRTGEQMNGKWWGGYYGWRWPHGAWIILESTLIAGENATLLSGNPAWLDLHRSQRDLIWSLRREDDGVLTVPARHGDQGWFDYRPLGTARDYIHTWFLSHSAVDLARLQERFPSWETWRDDERFSKAGSHAPQGWFAFVQGKNPDYPGQALDNTYAAMCRRLDAIDADDLSTVAERDVHHWQNLNPVVPEALIQMAMGTPGAAYQGGLLHAAVRYFDLQARRPGLPPHVAALVESITGESVDLTLVNTDTLATHEVIVQAGAFGEHEITAAQRQDAPEGAPPVAVHGKHLNVRLAPSAQARLHLGLKRFAHRPTYGFPAF